MASTASAKSQTSEGEENPKTSSVPALCLTAALKHAKQDALNHKIGNDWINIPAESFVERVRNVALGLAGLGIKPGDRIALLSENRPEWSIADLAILSLGAINVPIYTTQAVDQIRFILTDSGARAIFVSNKKLFKHAQEALAGLDFLERIIFFDAYEGEAIERSTTLASLERSGQERAINKPAAFGAYLKAIRPDDLATIIYTSGTTGEPKGVMLTHANFVSNVLTIAGGLPISSSDIALSVLPLSHIFERTGFYIFCYSGVSVYYTASFDQVAENLREVRPTVMTAVPRLFEKVYHRIVKKGFSQKGWKRRVFERSLNVGQRYAEAKDKRKFVGPALSLQQKMANNLVFSKWREGVGGRLRYFVSGGAPLSPALSYAFLAAGIPILQGYGATETCIVSANRPDNNRVGSVGLPFEGIEVNIADDGEILLRGPNVMRGYYGHPEETASVLQDDWFATGDVGHLDKEGHLYITDRKKDLFKLSNGKYVAPQQIESLLKQSEFVSQVVVVGTGRKQPAALIVPEWEAVRQALSAAGEEFPTDRAALAQLAAAIKLVQSDVTQLTKELADYERIRRIALLPDEFTIERGELTPTLKVKRRVIDQKFGSLIEELYS
ncbi:MAG TPA: long-chain fatty acid--CoA ligase [Pyrinomonadaceae bacterium]|nr:long-chain fatty acid--CoA ligase [Pyrinomonadaceae bacterium]